MFRNCIVRKPCKALVDGITSGLYPGKPDYELACKQHEHYIECLKQCGVQVEVLPPLEEYPDSVFVEDPAVVTRSCAIIANPGAASRNGEKRMRSCPPSKVLSGGQNPFHHRRGSS